MASRMECVTVDCAEPARLARFWAAALDYEVRDDQGHWIVLQPSHGDGPRLGFQQVPEPKIVKDRVHLDLRPLVGTLETEIARLEGLGARQVRLVTDNPGNVHTIMADPEGNEFCVSPPN